jgi:Mg/Co/Ni transporter MgtE
MKAQKENTMSDFEQAIKHAAEKAVLKIISDGSWIAPDYSNRFKLPPKMLEDIWKMVDIEKVKRKMADRLEEELAEKIINHMASELSTDIKQILSVKERREAIRHIAREHMDSIMKAGNYNE